MDNRHFSIFITNQPNCKAEKKSDIPKSSLFYPNHMLFLHSPRNFFFFPGKKLHSLTAVLFKITTLSPKNNNRIYNSGHYVDEINSSPYILSPPYKNLLSPLWRERTLTLSENAWCLSPVETIIPENVRHSACMFSVIITLLAVWKAFEKPDYIR